MLADIIFYSFSALFLAFCILQYYRLPLWISVTSSLLIAFSVGGIAFLILFQSNRKKMLSKKERESRDALLFHLALEKPERVRLELLTAFLKDGKEAHCEGEDLWVEGISIVPIFSLDPLRADMIAELIRKFREKKFSLACNSLTPEAEKLLSTFGIKSLQGNEIYSLFTRTDAIPEPLICGEIPRKTTRQKLKRSFSKSNARPFFISGILLLFMSLFTLFPVYYLISGSLLLLCAISVRLLGFSEQ